MELPADIADRLDALSEEGNQLSDGGFYDRALLRWNEALGIVPSPRSDWEASTWLLASIGDAHYQQRSFDLARTAFFDSLNCPGGQMNPFIHYRLGQCEWELKNEKNALEHLLRAYMLDGETLFKGGPEGAEYLRLLQDRRLI